MTRHDVLNMYGQIDQDAARALAESAAHGRGVAMSGHYYQSEQGATFAPESVSIPDEAFAAANSAAYPTTSHAPPVGFVRPGSVAKLGVVIQEQNGGFYEDIGDDPYSFTTQTNGCFIFGVSIRWIDYYGVLDDGHKLLQLTVNGSVVASVSGGIRNYDLAAPSSLVNGISMQSLATFARLNAGDKIGAQMIHWSPSGGWFLDALLGFWAVRVGGADRAGFPSVVDGGSE